MFIHDFIHIHTMSKEEISKQAILVIPTKSEGRISVVFDNSIGELPHLSRVEICVFSSEDQILETIQGGDAKDLARLIMEFC